MHIKQAKRRKKGETLGSFTDQSCFLVAFASGALSIMSLKYLGARQIVVTLVPVVIMLSYLALMISFRRLRVDDDQAGDNLYYLGFLYTLVSLGCALFQYSGASSRESIIQNFGIALTTTIVGLICRVVFGTMRHDPVETEREIRKQLTTVAARLRDQLIQANHIFETASVAVQQQSAEALAGYAQKLDEMVTTSLQGTSTHLTALTEHTQAMSSETAKLVSAVGSLVERVNAVEAPRDLIGQQLSPAVAALQKAADGIHARAEADNGLVLVLTESLENALRAVHQQPLRLESTVSGASQAVEAVSQLTSKDASHSADDVQPERAAPLLPARLEELQKKLEAVVRSTRKSLGNAASTETNGQNASIKLLEATMLEMVARLRAHNLEVSQGLGLSSSGDSAPRTLASGAESNGNSS